MFTLQNITRSLGFYIHIKRLAQVSKETCLDVVDYHDFRLFVHDCGYSFAA